MQENMNFDNGAKAGTIGGTLFCMVYTIHMEDIAKTVVLAEIGATVSFLVSIALKGLMKRLKK